MILVSKDGFKVSVSCDEEGRAKHASMSLSQYNMQGYAFITFFGNDCAQEICVSPSQGFRSVRNYKGGLLTHEVFQDLLYQKTILYAYDDLGRAIETRMDSNETVKDIRKTNPRPALLHAPVCLFEQLDVPPYSVLRGKRLANILPPHITAHRQMQK